MPQAQREDHEKRGKDRAFVSQPGKLDVQRRQRRDQKGEHRIARSGHLPRKPVDEKERNDSQNCAGKPPVRDREAREFLRDRGEPCHHRRTVIALAKRAHYARMHVAEPVGACRRDGPAVVYVRQLVLMDTERILVELVQSKKCAAKDQHREQCPAHLVIHDFRHLCFQGVRPCGRRSSLRQRDQARDRSRSRKRIPALHSPGSG